MTQEAIIQATFADYKRIKTRKVAVLCFEVPLEALHDTIAKLGGEPSIHSDTWCAIARLELNMADASTREGGYGKRTLETHAGEAEVSTSATKPKREMTLANIIGAHLSNSKFRDYLWSEYNRDEFADSPIDDKEAAKNVIYYYCGADSLTKILFDTDEARIWKERFYEPFQAWLARQS